VFKAILSFQRNSKSGKASCADWRLKE